MTSTAEEDQDRAGLEADLEADLQELEEEFGGASGEPSGPGPAGSYQGEGAAPVSIEPETVLRPEDLEEACELGFRGLMVWYAERLGIPEGEIPEGAIQADRQGPKIARALTPVANKYLPTIMGSLKEEIEAVVVVGFAAGSTMWRLQALAEARGTTPETRDEPEGDEPSE